jgi:hypothetical protein
MLTRSFSANIVLVFHELKYEASEYVTNFEGSCQCSSEGLQVILAQEEKRYFNYVYFIIVLLFLCQNEKLSYIFFHLIVCFVH